MDPADSTPPTVSLTASSSSVTADGMITLQATATDNVGVASVRFLSGTTTLSTVTSAPFTASVDVDASQNGVLMFSAVARDAAGNEATSNTVNVDVAIPNFPFEDTFDDEEIDATQWEVGENNGAVAETNGRLEFAIPATIPNEDSGASIRTVCSLAGDFDVTVDYELLTWPAESGVRVQLTARSSSERLSPGPVEAIEESYAANHTPVGGTLEFLATTDMSGRLRIARSGNQLTSYWWDGAAWVALNATTLSSIDPVRPGLGMSVPAGFHGGVATSAAFDDFQVTATGDPAC